MREYHTTTSTPIRWPVQHCEKTVKLNLYKNTQRANETRALWRVLSYIQRRATSDGRAREREEKSSKLSSIEQSRIQFLCESSTEKIVEF